MQFDSSVPGWGIFWRVVCAVRDMLFDSSVPGRGIFRCVDFALRDMQFDSRVHFLRDTFPRSQKTQRSGGIF